MFVTLAKSSVASVTFHCRGHRGISATHDKTLEFTRDENITRRATCVLGVASRHDDETLLALRGDVEVTLESGGYTDRFTATVSPFFLGDDSLVVRRGPGLRGRTFAHDASKSSADIDRALIAHLGTPDAELTVNMRAIGPATDGVLFVVSLPIGNDDDLAPRARHVLERVDLVLAEDTRRLRGLATRVDLEPAPIASYHDHNEPARADEVLARLSRGARVALVSDAGTPVVNDPGYVIVSRAVAAGHAVTPVPGPSAPLAALAAAGLPSDRFVYAGFLARRSAARQKSLIALAGTGATIVCLEAPGRVADFLDDVAVALPEWRVCIGREITKVFEEFRYGRAAELASEFADDRARGEFTIVLAPPAGGDERAADDVAGEPVDELLRSLLAQGVTATTLVRALSALPGMSRKEAYARVLELGQGQ